jgi:hypothetical protein
MNVRKLLDWRKLLIYSHRWMGIAFGLLFFAWFISGIAFMYWGMPSLTAEERLAHQDFVDLSKATLSPMEAAEKALVDPGGLRIEMRGDRPVYRMSGFPVYADTGDPVQFPVNAEQAMEIIRNWVPEHAATVRYDARLVESDQWTLQVAQVRQMPLHRIALDDQADTYYYVSEETGNIAMKTDRESRFKGFWSGVLHWVYFVPLRKQGNWWTNFIIWGSFIGGIMCLTGVVAGIWRLSPHRRFRQKGQASYSPYVGWMRWHHYAGLLFGLLSFTFVISGAFSVNPFGMFSGTPMTREQRQVVTGPPIGIEPITLDVLRTAVAELTASFRVKEIDLMQFRGEQYLIANRPLSFEHRIVSLARPERGTFTKFEHSIMMDIANEAMAGIPMQDAVWLQEYDNYWRSRDGARKLPVLRVRYLDEQKTWLYMDPHRGTMSKLEWIDRVDRWTYAALHEFDFPWLYERRPHWDIVLILVSIGGAVLSFTTLWPACKRLARHARRFARMIRPSRARQIGRVGAD